MTFMAMMRSRRNREVIGGCSLLALFVVSGVLAGIAAFSSGPIILGTELNTNGLVEYLCLGVGCEDIY
ncbi:MAG: hypothetical protein EOM26_07600 [Alphaproteobacteria bacterium]|nr:hypothetical protein [Alphaproteobacteria bacterium]